MAFEFSIPGAAGAQNFSVAPGTSVVFVGANGGGKTRLAVQIENTLGLNAHRISAHRALSLNPTVPKISERQALSGLRTGYSGPDSTSNVGLRTGHRWSHKGEIVLLNDFDYLVQALFAEQSNKSLETHRKARAGALESAEPTKFEHLEEIWGRLLPHRKLHISGDDIEVSIPGSDAKYKASDMSDGERAIFYMIGQALVAAADSLLVFDEPELHVHPSIMSKLWDELESARQDCAFLFITHDLEFAASRVAQKFIIRDYRPAPTWAIEAVPENTGFDEDITTLILGSRRPILFVEGTNTSLDLAIYRCCFPEWTVIHRGSCSEVIHSVVSMRKNADLTRVTCSGLVDADGYEPDDVAYLRELGILVLPVSEIENVILLPHVSEAIAKTDALEGLELLQRLGRLKTQIIEKVSTPEAIDDVVARYCRRRIDRFLKKIDLSEAASAEDLAAKYAEKTALVDVAGTATAAKALIETAIREQDLPKLLGIYDNKGLMALAAANLKNTRLADFESWITRVLRNNKAPAVVEAIRAILPDVAAR